MSRENANKAKTGATHFPAKLKLPDKGRVIKWFVVSIGWDLEPLDYLNDLTLGLLLNL